MAKWTLTEKAIKAQIKEAKAHTSVVHVEGPRAIKAYFDEGADRIRVELSSGADFRFPPSAIEELMGASLRDIAQVQVSPSGRTLRWKTLDVDLSIPALMAGIFGTKMWMAHLGRIGGQVSSKAKAAAARSNGMRGGRPALVPGQRLERPQFGKETPAKKVWPAKSVAASALSQSYKKKAGRSADSGSLRNSGRTERASKKR